MPFGKPLLDMLERMSCGGIVLDTSGHALRINPTAERVLKELDSIGNTVHLRREQVSGIIRRLLLMNNRMFELGKDTWSEVQRRGKRQLLFHAVKLDEGSDGGPDRLIILVDLDLSPQRNLAALQHVFGLTTAEAAVAADITSGKSLAEITVTRQISIATARTQLASVFAKTHTRRQAELVALLTRISILP